MEKRNMGAWFLRLGFHDAGFLLTSQFLGLAGRFDNRPIRRPYTGSNEAGNSYDDQQRAEAVAGHGESQS
jgi:hypothetical protein